MKNSIKKNFLYNILYQVVAIMVPLITSPYLARALGVENIGINSWTFSVVSYIAMFAVLGVNNYGNRTIAAARVNGKDLSSTFCSIYACQMTSSVLMTALYGIYVAMFAKEYKLIAALQIFHVIGNALDITWFFYGLEEFRVTVTRSAAIKLAGLAPIFLFVRTGDDLWKYTLIISGSAFLGQLIMWPFVLSRIKPCRPSFSGMLPHIKPILVLFIPVLAISVFVNMDKYMIGKLSSVLQNGYYENTDKIIAIPKAVITALGTVMLPRTAGMIAAGEHEKSRKYIELTMVYTAAVSSAFAFGMMAVGNTFAAVFWGEEFAPCGRLIACMAPAIIFSVTGNVIRTQHLIPRSKDREYTISLIAGAAVNFCVNLILIPELGALGAVTGTLAAEFIMTLFHAVFVRKDLKIWSYMLSGVPFYIFGFIMFACVRILCYGMENDILSLLLQIALGAVIYLLLSVAYICSSKKENIVSMKKEAAKLFAGSRNRI